jgi:hypothetical protein
MSITGTRSVASIIAADAHNDCQQVDCEALLGVVAR